MQKKKNRFLGVVQIQVQFIHYGHTKDGIWGSEKIYNVQMTSEEIVLQYKKKIQVKWHIYI